MPSQVRRVASDRRILAGDSRSGTRTITVWAQVFLKLAAGLSVGRMLPPLGIVKVSIPTYRCLQQ